MARNKGSSLATRTRDALPANASMSFGSLYEAGDNSFAGVPSRCRSIRMNKWTRPKSCLQPQYARSFEKYCTSPLARPQAYIASVRSVRRQKLRGKNEWIAACEAAAQQEAPPCCACTTTCATGRPRAPAPSLPPSISTRPPCPHCLVSRRG
jgi:hypothetical protein